MSFGTRIRDLRRKQMLSQRELAARLTALGLDADFTYLSKIENDNLLYLPSEKLIRGMATVLQADPEELLDLAGRFDQKALQDLVTEVPEAGVLLRRLQSRQVSREQIKRILDEVADPEQK